MIIFAILHEKNPLYTCISIITRRAMSLADAIRALSGIDCMLSSGITYSQQIKAGVPAPIANAGLFGNITNGLIRNEIAYGMQMYGNPAGNIINGYYGYGNPQANAMATYAMLGVCSPWFMFNSGMFGCGYYYPVIRCCY